MSLCLLVWPQVPSVYVACPVPVEYGLPKDGEQVLLRGLICPRWVLTRTCEGWPYSVLGMPAPRDLGSPPREGCALCSLLWALTPWPLFWGGREIRRERMVLLEAGEGSTPREKASGLTGDT